MFLIAHTFAITLTIGIVLSAEFSKITETFIKEWNEKSLDFYARNNAGYVIEPTDFIVTNTFANSSDCSDLPMEALGYAMNQCIPINSFSSYMYLPGKTENDVAHYSWPSNNRCSGNPAVSSFTVPTNCETVPNVQTVRTEASPPWKDYKSGFVFQ